jgi:hypothetical protein
VKEVNNFFKRYDLAIGVIVFLVITSIAVSTGVVKANKLNSNSNLHYAKIFKISSRYCSYQFTVSGTQYKGHFNNDEKKKFKIGDVVVIQYHPEDPSIHIFHSKMNAEKDLRDLKLLEVKLRDVW